MISVEHDANSQLIFRRMGPRALSACADLPAPLASSSASHTSNKKRTMGAQHANDDQNGAKPLSRIPPSWQSGRYTTPVANPKTVNTCMRDATTTGPFCPGRPTMFRVPSRRPLARPVQLLCSDRPNPTVVAGVNATPTPREITRLGPSSEKPQAYWGDEHTTFIEIANPRVTQESEKKTKIHNV